MAVESRRRMFIPIQVVWVLKKESSFEINERYLYKHYEQTLIIAIKQLKQCMVSLE
jgi:hypothetical protein